MTSTSRLLLRLSLILLVHLGCPATRACQPSDHTLVCVKISANQVYVGESVILQCVHFLTEQPVNVLMWKVNGSLLRNDRISIDPPATLSKLTLWKAQLSDSGNYSCITRLDNRSQVAYVQFRVYKPIHSRPAPPTEAEIGSTVTLQCNAEDYITIDWYRGTHDNPSNLDPLRMRKNGTSLVVTDVRLSDNGTYTCELLSVRVQYQKVDLIVVVSNNTDMSSEPTYNSDPSVSSRRALPAVTASASFLSSNSTPRGTSMEYFPSSSYPVASVKGNGTPAWLMPIVVVVGLGSLLSTICCLVGYCLRRRKTSRCLSVENPTYTLAGVSQSGQRSSHRETRFSGLHLYETMLEIKDTETDRDIDSAGYTILKNRNQNNGETLDASPTSISEQIPQDNSFFATMESELNQGEGKRKKSNEQNGKTVGDEKSPYVNIEDPY